MIDEGDASEIFPMSEVCGSLDPEVGQMSQDHDKLSKRPERVIIVDAENPLVEIHGRFVWEEEHERVVAEIAERAYADGYRAGTQAATRGLELRIRRRRGIFDYARLCVLAFLVILTVLMIPVIFF